MRKKRIVFTIVTAIVLFSILGFFGSCDLFNGLLDPGVTATERIDLFAADVKAGNYTTLYTHFSSTDTDNYEPMKAEGYWEPRPFHTDNAFSGITNIVEQSATDTTATVTATVEAAADYEVTFSLKKIDNDFYITVIDFAASYDNFDVRFIHF